MIVPKHLLLGILLMSSFIVTAQTSDRTITFGSYGRVGVGFSPGIEGRTSKQLNLLGQGSIGGRLEEQDYVELIGAAHFKPTYQKKDTTHITIQTRMALYSASSQFIGNVTTGSIKGLVVALPELFVQADNIVGSKWSAWIGAKFNRGDDIHIADHFYFDDHSSQGFGVTYNHTSFSAIFPSAVDTNATYPPYFYLNIVNGTPTLALRQRTVLIGEQILPLKNGAKIKLMAEFHKLANGSTDSGQVQTSPYNYPSDIGWVLGVKHSTPLKTKIAGSFNQFAVRYGHGIANGGDGGGSKTWLTYGAPDLATEKFTNAYSISVVEHFMLNLSNLFSLNGYALYTKSHGAAESSNKAPDYFGRLTFNQKTDFATGFRSFIYITDWFHLINEASFAVRKDGDQPSATMLKFSIVPTIVPTAKRDPWARPHLRLVLTAARYNDFAKDHLYSAYLQSAGANRWGLYCGIKTEWWFY
jgi:maltoporin